MKISIFFIITFFLFGCTGTKYKPTRESLEKEKLCNIVTYKVATKLKNEKKLIPCGSGGQTMHGVKKLTLSFEYHKPVDIDSGRELLVSSVQAFIDAVNEEKLIRPYLSNYPFTAQNVHIEVFLREVNGLCFISARQGAMQYDIRNTNGRLETIYRETYEEAVQKLEEQKNFRERT